MPIMESGIDFLDTVDGIGVSGYPVLPTDPFTQSSGANYQNLPSEALAPVGSIIGIVKTANGSATSTFRWFFVDSTGHGAGPNNGLIGDLTNPGSLFLVRPANATRLAGFVVNPDTGGTWSFYRNVVLAAQNVFAIISQSVLGSGRKFNIEGED